jgi:predicted transcriptional regulator
MAKQTNVKTGARLPEDLDKKLQEYANKISISKNAVILLALNDYLEQKT